LFPNSDVNVLQVGVNVIVQEAIVILWAKKKWREWWSHRCDRCTW